MTDPQTAADAAERVQRWLDAVQAADDRLGHDLHAVLEDRKRMAAELEQVRTDRDRQRNSAIFWRRRAYQLADLIPAEQMPDPDWYGEGASVALAERGEEMRDALTVAAELIDRLARPTPCDIDHNGHCGPHRVREAPLPCPHPLGRRFVEAWQKVQGPTAEKGPESP